MSEPSSRPPAPRSRFHLEGVPDPSELRLDLEPEPRPRASVDFDDSFRLLWLQPDWFQSDADRLVWMLVHPTTTREPSGCFVPPGPGPAEARDATWGDVLKAVWAVPCVQAAVNEVFDRVKDDASETFDQMSTGERAATIGVGATFALGTLAAIYADAEARDFVIGAIEGRSIPVPRVEGLKFSLYRRGMGLEIPIPRVRGLTVEGHFELGQRRWQDVEYEVRVEYRLIGW